MLRVPFAKTSTRTPLPFGPAPRNSPGPTTSAPAVGAGNRQRPAQNPFTRPRTGHARVPALSTAAGPGPPGDLGLADRPPRDRRPDHGSGRACGGSPRPGCQSVADTDYDYIKDNGSRGDMRSPGQQYFRAVAISKRHFRRVARGHRANGSPKRCDVTAQLEPGGSGRTLSGRHPNCAPR